MNNSEYNFPTEKEQKIELASQILAISHTLISKGIVTEEEWQHTLLRARQRMDQKAKELQDAYDEQHPKPKSPAEQIIDLMAGDIPDVPDERF